MSEGLWKCRSRVQSSLWQFHQRTHLQICKPTKWVKHTNISRSFSQYYLHNFNNVETNSYFPSSSYSWYSSVKRVQVVVAMSPSFSATPGSPKWNSTLWFEHSAYVLRGSEQPAAAFIVKLQKSRRFRVRERFADAQTRLPFQPLSNCVRLIQSHYTRYPPDSSVSCPASSTGGEVMLIITSIWHLHGILPWMQAGWLQTIVGLETTPSQIAGHSSQKTGSKYKFSRTASVCSLQLMSL